MLRVAVSSSSDMKEEDGTEACRPITGGGSCPLVIVGSEASNRSALMACQMEGLRLRSCCVHPLRERQNSPSVAGFPECQKSGTRERESSPSVALGEELHSEKRGFPECRRDPGTR